MSFRPCLGEGLRVEVVPLSAFANSDHPAAKESDDDGQVPSSKVRSHGIYRRISYPSARFVVSRVSESIRNSTRCPDGVQSKGGTARGLRVVHGHA